MIFIFQKGMGFTLLILLLAPALVIAISYKCVDDQVLIVQSFGNDTIRMHCQRLNFCGKNGFVRSLYSHLFCFL